MGKEVEKAYLARKQVTKDSKAAYYHRLDFIQRKEAEKKCICQSCNEKREFLRYILDYGVVICYDCYIGGLQEEAWSYPYSRNLDDMDMYLGEGEWEECWEEEYPHMVKEEESDVLKLFKVFDKQLGI